MRKIILAFMLCMLMVSCSWADRAPKLVDFPTIGYCTGNNVRLREEPNTDSKILGKLNEGVHVVVIDETFVNGEKWYKIDHPTRKGIAYVFGKYLEAIYVESYQAKPLHKLIMDLYLTYGMTMEKAIALSGKPKKREREIIGSDKIERVTMDWGNFSLEYLGGTLTAVDVKRGNMPFGDINIGDSVDDLRREFGEPTDGSDTYYSYQESEMTYITFNLKNNKVSGMNYQVYYDIEPE